MIGGCSDRSFPKEVRLRRRREFDRVHRQGRRLIGRFTLMLCLANELPVARFGLTVSRKVGNAVTRNRVKRQLREIVRHHAGALPCVDVVIIARPSAATAPPEVLRRDVNEVLGQLAQRLAP